MFCPNCGLELPAGSKFCAKCGTPLAGAVANNQASVTPPSANQPKQVAQAPSAPQPTQNSRQTTPQASANDSYIQQLKRAYSVAQKQAKLQTKIQQIKAAEPYASVAAQWASARAPLSLVPLGIVLAFYAFFYMAFAWGKDNPSLFGMMPGLLIIGIPMVVYYVKRLRNVDVIRPTYLAESKRIETQLAPVQQELNASRVEWAQCCPSWLPDFCWSAEAIKELINNLSTGRAQNFDEALTLYMHESK